MVGEVSGGQKCYTKPGSWDVSSFRSSVDIVPVNLETSKSVEQSTNAGAWKRAKEIKIAKRPVYQAAKELVLGSIQHVLGWKFGVQFSPATHFEKRTFERCNNTAVAGPLYLAGI